MSTALHHSFSLFVRDSLLYPEGTPLAARHAFLPTLKPLSCQSVMPNQTKSRLSHKRQKQWTSSLWLSDSLSLHLSFAASLLPTSRPGNKSFFFKKLIHLQLWKPWSSVQRRAGKTAQSGWQGGPHISSFGVKADSLSGANCSGLDGARRHRHSCTNTPLKAFPDNVAAAIRPCVRAHTSTLTHIHTVECFRLKKKQVTESTVF